MQELIEQLDRCALEEDFSGVISISDENGDLYAKSFGFRDVANNLLNEVVTKFGIASGTKFFTALGIGKLIERAELTLDTKMSEIYAEQLSFIDPDATIRHLLSHTSGIYDYYDEEIVEDFDDFFLEIPWYQLTTPSDYWPLFEGKKMKFRPSARFSYSNGGFVFLGILIEKISGRPYRDFIQDEVLHPAGMVNSGFFAFNNLPSNTANGYLADGKTSNIYNIPIRGGADGGMFTTASDMNFCWRKFLAGQMLSAEIVDQFLKTQVQFEHKPEYGYGCGIYKKLDDSHYYLVGGDAGVGFHSAYFAEQKLVISVLSNRSAGDAKIVELLRKANGE